MKHLLDMPVTGDFIRAIGKPKKNGWVTHIITIENDGTVGDTIFSARIAMEYLYDYHKITEQERVLLMMGNVVQKPGYKLLVVRNQRQTMYRNIDELLANIND